MKMIQLRALFAAFFLLGLCGCQDNFTLLNNNNVPVGKATLDYSGNSRGTARFLIDNKEFKGSWSVVKIYEDPPAQRFRLTGTRSYEDYMLGNTADQLRHGHAVLLDQGGAQLNCDFYFRTEPRAAQCSLGGKTLDLRMSQSTSSGSEAGSAVKS